MSSSNNCAAYAGSENIFSYSSNVISSTSPQPKEKILSDIFFYSTDNLTQLPNYRVTNTIAHFSALLVKLSEQADKSTRTIVRLTYAIVFLTIVLLLITAIPVIKDFMKPSEQPDFKKQTYQQPKENKKPDIGSPLLRIK
jgi:hypothetical protein